MPYKAHLAKDKKLKPLIEKIDLPVLKKRKSVFLDLCGSIMSQQLSVKVADVIYNRFVDLFENDPSPAKIIAIEHDALRSIGLSNAKARYVKNVAAFAVEKGLEFKQLNKMHNDAVIEYLTEIKGVGRWTAEMLMMFTLGREDVFAADDLGIQTAMIKLYNLDATDKKALRQSMLKISQKWKPYRTYACMYLWRYKDGKVK